MENSTKSTVLLKADTGADVKLDEQKKHLINSLEEAKGVLQLTPIRMEKTMENTAVKVLGMFQCISEVEGQSLQTVYFMWTDL